MGSRLEIADFEPLARLSTHWPEMRDECCQLDRSDVLSDVDRDEKQHTEAFAVLAERGPHWLMSWGPEKAKWLTWGLVLNDEQPLGDAGVPRTMALLAHLRGLKVAGLSLFQPGARTPIHAHGELAAEGLLTFHLGLQVPPDRCYLYADGDFVPEREGQGVVFNGGRPHFTWNASDADRLLLYCEFSPARLRWVE